MFGPEQMDNKGPENIDNGPDSMVPASTEKKADSCDMGALAQSLPDTPNNIFC